METQASTPLLALCPGLLGAGGRLGNINLFLEMSRLSSIAQHCSNIFKIRRKSVNELDEMPNLISPEYEESDIDTTSERQQNDMAKDQPEYTNEEQLDHMNEEQPDQTTEEQHNNATRKHADHSIENQTYNMLEKQAVHVTAEQSASSSKCRDDLTTNENDLSTQNSETIGNGKRDELVDYPFNEKSLNLFETFTKLGINYRTEKYREKEGRLEVDPMIFYCKNLFLKDRKGQLYLCIFHEDVEVDLKQLRKELKAYRNFSFGTADDLDTVLGVVPGGVTPLALMNENARDVRMVISNSLVQEGASLMFHPMDSNLATNVSLSSLLRFLKYFNHVVTFVS